MCFHSVVRFEGAMSASSQLCRRIHRRKLEDAIAESSTSRNFFQSVMHAEPFANDGQVYERRAMHQWAAQKTCIATSQLDMHDLARDEHILYKGSPC